MWHSGRKREEKVQENSVDGGLPTRKIRIVVETLQINPQQGMARGEQREKKEILLRVRS